MGRWVEWSRSLCIHCVYNVCLVDRRDWVKARYVFEVQVRQWDPNPRSLCPFPFVDFCGLLSKCELGLFWVSLVRASTGLYVFFRGLQSWPISCHLGWSVATTRPCSKWYFDDAVLSQRCRPEVRMVSIRTEKISGDSKLQISAMPTMCVFYPPVCDHHPRIFQEAETQKKTKR